MNSRARLEDRETTLSQSDLRAWIGRSEEKRDRADSAPIRRLANLLDHETPPWAPGVLPPLGHWLYFLPNVRQSERGPDGHPNRGGFLPPVALPRRMWAGGRIEFSRPIPFGAEMTRRSTIVDIAEKSGASGPMTFVVVQARNLRWRRSRAQRRARHRLPRGCGSGGATQALPFRCPGKRRSFVARSRPEPSSSSSIPRSHTTAIAFITTVTMRRASSFIPVSSCTAR